MEKEFVPYDESLALKELGFDEPCIRGWDKNGKIWYHPDSDIVLDNLTFSQAFRWFRDKYGLLCRISYKRSKYKFEYQYISSANNLYMTEYETYEEAELECLKKLIKIVKKNK